MSEKPKEERLSFAEKQEVLGKFAEQQGVVLNPMSLIVLLHKIDAAQLWFTPVEKWLEEKPDLLDGLPVAGGGREVTLKTVPAKKPVKPETRIPQETKPIQPEIITMIEESQIKSVKLGRAAALEALSEDNGFIEITKAQAHNKSGKIVFASTGEFSVLGQELDAKTWEDAAELTLALVDEHLSLSGEQIVGRFYLWRLDVT